jgi:hypothetical protein
MVEERWQTSRDLLQQGIRGAGDVRRAEWVAGLTGEYQLLGEWLGALQRLGSRTRSALRSGGGGAPTGGGLGLDEDHVIA